MVYIYTVMAMNSYTVIPGLVNVYKKLWKVTFFVGKFTISMAIFNC